MISILVPTRGRPADLERLLDSIEDETVDLRNVEVVLYIDDDDDSYRDTDFDEWSIGITILRGERIVLSEMWNECWKASEQDIGMICGDDIVFRTRGWDKRVREAFRQYPDRIVLVHGNDLSTHGGGLATHPLLSWEWVEASGYFAPPHFSSDMNDVWLTEVANLIGRKVYLEDVVTEHMHYSIGKAPKDKTAEEKEARGREDKVVEKYHALAGEREAQVKNLQEAIAEASDPESARNKVVEALRRNLGPLKGSRVTETFIDEKLRPAMEKVLRDMVLQDKFGLYPPVEMGKGVTLTKLSRRDDGKIDMAFTGPSEAIDELVKDLLDGGARETAP